MLDFRSDTVTLPTAAMKAAMLAAPLGDDVFGEDPSVCALEERVAQLLGKEAALFVPSGTMSNLIAVRLHCRPGDQVLCEANCHIYYYEQGGYAQLAGAAIRPVEGTHGVLEPRQLQGLICPDDVHFPRTRLLTLENTHNRGGGRVQPYENVAAICRWARENSLATHLDGARLMNAASASGIAAQRWAEHFDTVSICFSKGLGAPAGSALAGPKNLIAAARRQRKVLGGGMRQAGILAAAALYALDHHIERLADDHAAARRLAEAIDQIDGLTVSPDVQTNIVMFNVDARLGTAAQFAAALKTHGLLMLALGPTRIRAVTHLGIGRPEVDRAITILGDTVKTGAKPDATRPESTETIYGQ